MKKWLIANWKMNGHKEKVANFVRNISISHDQNCTKLIYCPPHPYLLLAHEEIKKKDSHMRFCLGGQDLSIQNPQGAYTGEVDASMLKDCGAHYVLIGHSERRQYYKEDDGVLFQKLSASIHHQITPIFCVGESYDDYKKGLTFEVIQQQLEILQLSQSNLCQCIIAYEPVWAIGTGLTPNVEELEIIYGFLRSIIKNGDSFPILYGGSVTQRNFPTINQTSFDGFLLGSASLDVDTINNIIKNL
jgi:triosephosphate isomerase